MHQHTKFAINLITISGSDLASILGFLEIVAASEWDRKVFFLDFQFSNFHANDDLFLFEFWIPNSPS